MKGTMDDNGKDPQFLPTVAPTLRKFLENIESPFVWVPLGLFILSALGYPLTSVKAFPYLAIALLLFAFGADGVGRWKNRQTPRTPSTHDPKYRDEIFKYLSGVHAKVLVMSETGKVGAAQALTKKNLRAVNEALATLLDDAEFLKSMGYALKEIYQTSKSLLATHQRQAYLARAKQSLEYALGLDPDDPRAHNAMGNVLFFEGHFDEALIEHDVALRLTDDNYPAAERDKGLVIRVKKGEIPFDF